jgi:hypothetical protein
METGVAYAITVYDVADDAMVAVRAALADAGVREITLFRDGSEPENRVYVDSASIMEAVTVINGLGYATDEDAGPVPDPEEYLLP